MVALQLPEYSEPTQEFEIVSNKRPPATPIRHTPASLAALAYLVEQLGDRYKASQIIRDAIIEKAERLKSEKSVQNHNK